MATSLEIPVRSGRLLAEGDADATPEQLATLLRLTERYCVVHQSLTRTPEVTMSWAAG